MNSEKIEKTLQEWKLPPSSASDVFKRKSIFSFSPDPTLHTVEKEIPLSEGYASFPLIDNLKRVYKNQYSFIHVGMIQVGLKPTKLGSKTSAIICLRDGRTLKFGISVLGMVESSLSDGPIYFSFFPTYCVSLADRHSAFTIDIKTQGCSGKGNVVLMYRFHYKVTDGASSETKNLARALVDSRGETTLFLTNVGRSRSRSNRVVSNKIYWDQVSVPEKWLDENNPSSSAATQKEGEVARMDWKEAAEAYALKVDVPGFKKDEVRVEVEAGRELVISGERRLNEQEEDGKWWCIERSSGKFLRRLRLPEDAKMDEVMAGMENGVLTVTVPKDEVKVKEKPEVKVIHISG